MQVLLRKKVDRLISGLIVERFADRAESPWEIVELFWKQT